MWTLRPTYLAAVSLLALPSLASYFAPADTRPKAKAAHVRQSKTRIQALLVGGGPDLEHNQVAIESNVRYLDRILPTDAKRRVLFADGDRTTKSVLYTDGKGKDTYRATQIEKIDGATKLPNIKTQFEELTEEVKATPKSPVLLYFTGHGSPDGTAEYQNNAYDMWGGQELKVHELAPMVQAIPSTHPVVLVMVECFSGAFGNVIFRNGRAENPLTDQPICGFFASIPQRMAAGCTPNVNEEDYKDFTGYFFAALSGMDRLGRPIKNADYNGDGKVGMDEAYAYTLIHDDSIDTPVCTSDVFLRKFVPSDDKHIFDVPYEDVRQWATPAQRAALDAMSEKCDLTGSDRLSRAYTRFLRMNPASETDRDVYLLRLVRLGKSTILAHTLRTGNDEALKQKFEALIALEHGNPFF